VESTGYIPGVGATQKEIVAGRQQAIAGNPLAGRNAESASPQLLSSAIGTNRSVEVRILPLQHRFTAPAHAAGAFAFQAGRQPSFLENNRSFP